jgi:hypothetical protein
LIEIEKRHRGRDVGDVSGFLTDLGYEGYFVLNGELSPLSRFDQSIHQNPANLGGWKLGYKRQGIYVNNFFFLPSSKVDMLSTAVSLQKVSS